MKFALVGLGAGVAVGVFALVVAVLAMGAGHGSYLPAKLLFPHAMLTILLYQKIGGVAVGLASIQFPIYGLIVGGAKSNRGFAVAVLTAVHLIAAVLAAMLVNSSFPNFP